MAKQGKDLFEVSTEAQLRQDAPLAARMRPLNFDEYVGQEHLIGKGRALRTSIEADRLPSMVLWGPPGSGKTTLARIIASQTQASFKQVSAVASGVAELRQVIKEAKDIRGMYRRSTILFIDEIHRFNKAQQDVVLPHVEDGTVTLIGATTENPSFEVIAPLLSRCRVFTLKPLEESQIRTIVERALTDPEKGLGREGVSLEPEALDRLVDLSGNDARIALNTLELAVWVASSSGARVISVDAIEDALQRRTPRYDKSGDQHYDIISAFIKSLRGSDPDAALYWMSRMIEAGEDPLFIVRRMVILAAEDVGLADPTGPHGGSCGTAGGPLRRDARRIHPHGRSRRIPCHGAQEQLGVCGLPQSQGRCREDSSPPRAAAPEERAHRTDACLGVRQRLQVRP